MNGLTQSSPQSHLTRKRRPVHGPQLLEKQLGLWDVYALATGATLSSGFFLLPGLGVAGAGAAMPLSYILAAVILLPGLSSMVELATAMPRAGGIYYFLDRSLGPLVGAIGGFGTWIALILKSAFALIGVGAYMQLFAPGLEMAPIAAGFAVLFGVVNYFGTKKSGSFQIILLVGLLVLLLWFCGRGLVRVEAAHFAGFLDSGSTGIISTAGLVIVSYMGLTKVVGVAEEVKNPGRNLPLGIFLALATVVGVFVVGVSVMVGVVGVETLARDGGDLTPAATVAASLVGPWGAALMTIAAVLAFSSAANAGILSASRYPLAMGRDKLIPEAFSGIGARGTPTVGIAVTVGLILVSVTLFDPTKIAKLASAFMLVLFALACLGVIVMRESRIESYDPGFRSPLYPTVQILGALGPVWLVLKMGLLPSLFTGGLVAFGAIWYKYYSRHRSEREGAIFHVFERLGQQRHDRLDAALREILTERGPRDADAFDELCAGAPVIDIPGPMDFEELATCASRRLAIDLPVPACRLLDGFLEGTRIGATPVSRGAALPHLQLDVVDRPFLVLARVLEGVRFELDLDLGQGRLEEPIRAVFFLVGPKANPGLHLHILAQIAGRVDSERFMDEWLAAESDERLREALSLTEGMLVIPLRNDQRSRTLIGLKLSDVPLPDGMLVTTIRRSDRLIIASGDSVFCEGDHVTVIGTPEAIRLLQSSYGIGKGRPRR